MAVWDIHLMKIPVLLLLFLLSGCISTAGQYRGAANGLEVHKSGDDLMVNVSGNAAFVVAPDGTMTAISYESNLSDLFETIQAIQGMR